MYERDKGGGAMGWSVGLSIERSWVQNPPVPFQIIYPTMPKSLRMLLVYPERMAVGVKTKEFFYQHVDIPHKE